MSVELWLQSIDFLRDELPAQHFNTWIRPLQVEVVGDELHIFAPNRFVLDWVNDKYINRILELMAERNNREVPPISLLIGSKGAARQSFNSTPSLTNTTRAYAQPANNPMPALTATAIVEAVIAPSVTPRLELEHARQLQLPETTLEPEPAHSPAPVPTPIQSAVSAPSTPTPEPQNGVIKHVSALNRAFTFDSFVEGKSNQLARAAAWQVADNPKHGYNPLFLYGGVGLGKTHLMHAVGNHLLQKNPKAKIIYLHSERFVADMVRALQNNAINEFKNYYRSVDALLIDDIQFFAKKERSQEEFFHTFNALLEGDQQVILTSDRYPKEIDGLEERLKSRFGWGLTVAVEPPELETRVAILIKKAEQSRVPLSHDCAFFIAKRIRSNVRELEGALKRVIAHAHFTNEPISIDLIRESLKDLLALQEKLVSIDNIQRTVAEYYKIKLSDILSKRRSRSVARPRQVAMALAKEITNHSLPEIGNAFSGRDHTTVLHACRKIAELSKTDADIREDYKNLLRTLTT